MTSLAALQAGDPQRVGPYVLLGRLGSGGMGRVYLARSPGGRMVAVKVIRANLAEDAGFRARFAREVSAARKVGGLFTAQVVDADIDGPVPWLVTAYVPGTSLSDAVERQGPLPDASVLALAAGLAEGLIAIHAVGVIHRDLKPSNVLLAQDGPRIIDFGISSAAEATALTGTGFMIGSPGFMSPEQAEGLIVGPASDIFSLAGVLIYAARGEGPFGSGDTAALLYRVVHGKPNVDHVPDNLRPLIKRSLSRDPKRRPTATQFLAELSEAYPAAADLTNWLSPRILDPAAPADISPHPPAASGGSMAGGSQAGGSQAGGSLAGGSLAGRFDPDVADPVPPPAADAMAPMAFAAEAMEEPPTGGNTPAGPAGPDDTVPADPATSHRGGARIAGRPGIPGTTGAFRAGELSGTARLPGTTGSTRLSGLAGILRRARSVGLAGIPWRARLLGSEGYSGQQGYSGPEGYSGQQGYSGPQGYPGQQQYPEPQGYRTGQGDPVAPGGSGYQGGPPGGQGAQGSSWWSGQPGGMPQTPLPAQRMPGGPGMPGADQWYQPPAGPGRPRKRPGWLIPAGAAAAIVVIVVALVLALGSGSPKTATSGQSVSPTPSRVQSASSGPQATPTIGNLQLYQLRAGDCLTGANLNLNLATPWPKLSLAVPCSQGHTAEVFYANNYYWPKNDAYPGDATIKKDATAGCDGAFRSYVGIAYSQSQYTWTDIVPDSATWPSGDRGLHCVAYYAPSGHLSGKTVYGSIKGTAR